RFRLDDVEGMAEGVLHDRLAPGRPRQRALERALEPLEALVVEPRVADDLRRDRPLRVEAELLGVEAETSEVLRLEDLRLARIGLAGNVDKALRAIRQRPVERRRIEAELLGRGECEIARIRDLARIGVNRRRDLPDRERLAV